ncbi:MAG: hypothetical protein ACJAUL_004007, partial [Paraglaciecola sp.]
KSKKIFLPPRKMRSLRKRLKQCKTNRILGCVGL